MIVASTVRGDPSLMLIGYAQDDMFSGSSKGSRQAPVENTEGKIARRRRKSKYYLIRLRAPS
jgi:hypothetical protein